MRKLFNKMFQIGSYIFFAISAVLCMLGEADSTMRDFFGVNLLKKLSIPMNYEQIMAGVCVTFAIWLGLAIIREIFFLK